MAMCEKGGAALKGTRETVCIVHYMRFDSLPVFIGISTFVIIPIPVALGVESMMKVEISCTPLSNIGSCWVLD